MGPARRARELHLSWLHGHGAERGGRLGGGEGGVVRAEPDGAHGHRRGVDGRSGAVVRGGGELYLGGGFGDRWGADLFLVFREVGGMLAGMGIYVLMYDDSRRAKQATPFLSFPLSLSHRPPKHSPNKPLPWVCDWASTREKRSYV